MSRTSSHSTFHGRLACAAGVLGLGLALACGSAPAATLVVEIDNIPSAGVKGSPENSMLTFALGADAYVTGFRWDVNVTAFTPSWLSELTLEFTNSWGVGVQYSPSTLEAPGTASNAGQIDLVNSGLGFYLRPDGLLHLEFFESYDDFPGAADGRWNFGTLSFEYTPAVPEPAGAALLLLGCAALATLRRRRPESR